MLTVALLGVLAGTITTVAGVGGGMTMLLALAALTDPLYALAVTAPALLVGNAHRAWLYWQQSDHRVAGRLVLGALPGSLLGGLIATSLPSLVLQLGMVGMALLGMGRALGWVRVSPPLGAAVPLGAMMGVITATSGGAGLVLAPFLLALGLQGVRYVGTIALVAVALHSGRLLAYAAGGAIDTATTLEGLALAGSVLAGNLLGHQLRRLLTAKRESAVQLVVLAACVLMSLAGLA